MSATPCFNLCSRLGLSDKVTGITTPNDNRCCSRADVLHGTLWFTCFEKDSNIPPFAYSWTLQHFSDEFPHRWSESKRRAKRVLALWWQKCNTAGGGGVCGPLHKKDQSACGNQLVCAAPTKVEFNSIKGYWEYFSFPVFLLELCLITIERGTAACPAKAWASLTETSSMS